MDFFSSFGGPWGWGFFSDFYSSEQTSNFFSKGTNDNEIWFLAGRGRYCPPILGSDSSDTYTATTRTDGLANIQLTHES